jgi:hypothetical protein
MRVRPAFLVAGVLSVLAAGSGMADTTGKKLVHGDEARAVRAAVDATHGKAFKVARDNEAGANWEVEVLAPAGRRQDVLLDRRFQVLNVSDEQDPSEKPGRKGSSATANADKTARQAQLAARAAAKAVGGGVLLDVDREREKRATWEVEFMKLDGKKVNVQLDDRYKVVRVTRGKNAN